MPGAKKRRKKYRWNKDLEARAVVAKARDKHEWRTRYKNADVPRIGPAS